MWWSVSSHSGQRKHLWLMCHPLDVHSLALSSVFTTATTWVQQMLTWGVRSHFWCLCNWWMLRWPSCRLACSCELPSSQGLPGLPELPELLASTSLGLHTSDFTLRSLAKLFLLQDLGNLRTIRLLLKQNQKRSSFIFFFGWLVGFSFLVVLFFFFF